MGHGSERTPLHGRHFDITVIGGGVNGVAIARECARAGRRTLLVEQNDFASGTTSRSTRIIHGGLRYLEHGEIGLVRESLRERQRLSTERPHLVRPLEFVLAMPPGRRSALELRLGLWLYSKLGGAKSRSSADGPAFEKALDRQRESLHVFRYEDAQCEFPERLVAEWLRDAMRAGAVVRNHTAALRMKTSAGRVRGVLLRDQMTGAEYEVGTSHVVNATGPWADALCSTSEIHTGKPIIGGVRGTHLVLPRFPGAPHSAVYTEAMDGRPVFLVPWNGQILFGTTEIADNGDPDAVQPSAQEVEYLLQALHRLWPRSAACEVSFAMAGVRPLPHANGKSASSVTRRHFLHDHAAEGAAGAISVVGGKLTTAASLARECVRKLGISTAHPRGSRTFVHGAAFDGMLEQFAHDVAQIGGIPKRAARALVAWHGGEAIAVARTMAADPRYRRLITDGSDHLAGEAVFAVQHEAAVTLSDILLRRVPVALSRDWSEFETYKAARTIGNLLGWNDWRIASEAEHFEAERSRFLVRRPAVRNAA